jgi:hypothetical protein
MDERKRVENESVDDGAPQKGVEKPQGMPLTLGSGGYGGTECTGEEAEQTGHCPGNE